MLEVRQSNRLEVLADALVARLGMPTDRPVLESDLVVVQSPGMATWLRHRTAEALGIAAAIEFPLPASFLWRVVRALCADVPEQSPYEKPSLRWHLFGLLAPDAGLLEDPRCKRLARYLEDDETGLKRIQLADRIADVLDQYLVYRPEWIRRWSAGEDLPDVTAAEPWQPLLWRALRAAIRTQRGVGAETQDRAALLDAALRRLAGEDCRSILLGAGLPPRVSVFGISAMPPEQLRLLLALAEHVDLVLYAFNPCREYWSDIVSERWLARLEAEERVREETAPTHPYYDKGHPLLAELGSAGRDFVDLVLELGPDAELVDDFEEPGGRSVLETLQRDVLTLDPKSERIPIAEGDASLAFVECHGPQRELEVLHDWLLARFEAHAELRPRDVVVMIPDIDRYAPYVEAVFGGGDAATRIPHAISDRALAGEAPVLTAIATLLRLPRSRLPASEVLGLLETPAVQRAWDLDEQDLELLDHRVAEAGVRWGLDDAHWVAAGFPAADGGRPNSWAFGADRMLLGYAMGEAELPFGGRTPLPGVEGSSAEAVGRLLAFVDRLAHHAERLRGPLPPAEWRARIEALLAECIDEGAEETLALNGVREALAEMEERSAAAGVGAPLSLDVLLALLEPALGAREAGHRFLGGRVTFCTLMPMRTIPFRIVALLGMNDADYPRREVPLDFDLLPAAPRKGDRARRQEDRFLFLEAVLAAREHLLVSWSGRSPVDDSEEPPSVVVSALLDAVDRRFVAADGHPATTVLRRSHPLQPFGAKYDGRGLSTASTLWALPAAEHEAPVRGETGAASLRLPAPEAETSLELRRLAAFFADPSASLLAERFGVRFGGDAAELDDDEPFALTGLERYRVRDDALQVLRTGGDASAFLARETGTGRLPHLHAGREALAAADTLLRGYRALLGPLLDAPAPPLAIDLEVTELEPSLLVAGELRGATRVARLLLRAGNANERDRVRAWVEHLALCATAAPRPTLLVDGERVRVLEPKEPADARARIVDLLTLRAELLVRPEPLLCRCSAQFAAKILAGKDADDALAAARDAWEADGRYGPVGEGRRQPTRRLWPIFPGDEPALADAFMAVSLRVWAPLLEAEQDLTYAKAGAAIQERLDALAAGEDDG